MGMDDGAILYELWGDLVDKEHGREPRPKEKLVTLLRETANYMVFSLYIYISHLISSSAYSII